MSRSTPGSSTCSRCAADQAMAWRAPSSPCNALKAGKCATGRPRGWPIWPACTGTTGSGCDTTACCKARNVVACTKGMSAKDKTRPCKAPFAAGGSLRQHGTHATGHRVAHALLGIIGPHRGGAPTRAGRLPKGIAWPQHHPALRETGRVQRQHGIEHRASVRQQGLALVRPKAASLARRQDERLHAHAVGPNLIGKARTRCPLSTNNALATAGAMGGVPGSPTPPGGWVLGTMCVSMRGMCAICTTG